MVINQIQSVEKSQPFQQVTFNIIFNCNTRKFFYMKNIINQRVERKPKEYKHSRICHFCIIKQKFNRYIINFTNLINRYIINFTGYCI